MNRDEFKEIIDYILSSWNYADRMYSGYKIDIYDSAPLKTICKLEKFIFEKFYGNDGYEWISWFLYEKMAHKDPSELKAYDENGAEICSNIDELYDFLEKNHKKNLDK